MSTQNDLRIDPTALQDWSRPLERVVAELYCLGRVLIPMEDSHKTRNLIALAVVGVWIVLLLNVQVADDGAITMQPDVSQLVWLSLTAIVFGLVGRMWELEVTETINANLLSRTGGSASDSSSQDHNQARHPDQQRDITNEYANPDQREQATEDYPDDD